MPRIVLIGSLVFALAAGANPPPCDLSGLIREDNRPLQTLGAGENSTVYSDGTYAFKEPKGSGTTAREIFRGLEIAHQF